MTRVNNRVHPISLEDNYIFPLINPVHHVVIASLKEIPGTMHTVMPLFSAIITAWHEIRRLQDFEIFTTQQVENFFNQIPFIVHHPWRFILLQWCHISVMVSQINDKSTVWSTACIVKQQMKHWSFTTLALCYGNPPVTIGFPSQWVSNVQFIPRNMHTVFALLCFVVVIHWLILPYPSGLLHWHCGNLTIAPVPAKQPWWIWINTSCEFIMNDCITTAKQSTTKPCAYFLGYTVECMSLSWYYHAFLVLTCW